MSLPIGTWSMYSNGFFMSLLIQGSGDPTTFVGSITENQVLQLTKCSWNDALSEIRFTRTLTPADGGEVQNYIGFLFDRTVPLGNLTSFGNTPVMAGTFTSSGGFENPGKAAAGWGWFAYSVGDAP
jgi:hypothetical protein